MTGDLRRPVASGPRSAPTGPGGRRGTVVLAVTVVLGTVLLLWGADRLARWGAESVLSRAVQEQTGVLEPPTVEVEGGPVLFQALRGRYDHVEVGIDSLSSGPLRLRHFRADLDGVYLSFHDLLDSNTAQVFVERSTEEAFLGYDDLDRYLGFTGRALDVEPADDGQLRVRGQVDVLGEEGMVTALVRVDAEDRALVLRPSRLERAEPLDGLPELLVNQRFTLRVPLDPLPFGQRVTEIEVQPTGLAIRTSGSGVVLGS